MTDLRGQICDLVKELQTSATDAATKKVNEIVNVSAHYVSDDNHEKLRLFHDMYFASKGDLETQKSDINAEVDDIFDQAAELMNKNKSEEEIVRSIKVSRQAEQDRLQLSGLQKKLEGLISFKEGMREQLAPVMSSMQFEDATRQRVEHIVDMFSEIVRTDAVRNPVNAPELASRLADQISIKDEREAYYKLVLHEEAPAHVESDSFFF